MEGSRFTNEKTDVEEQVFRQFGLDINDGLFHPEGNIPAKFLGKNGEKKEMLWGIRKGSHYTPETHAHAHTLTIEHGSGIISINGKEVAYKKGDSFEITGNTPHGFIRVDETTIVKQEQPAR
ncbi:cupin domain-containing protein [Candidatus Nomurabacteria bacterium]|nr:cupin domain-containing protein [Candidatus Nomurabacteria bacterium]